MCQELEQRKTLQQQQQQQQRSARCWSSSSSSSAARYPSWSSGGRSPRGRAETLIFVPSALDTVGKQTVPFLVAPVIRPPSAGGAPTPMNQFATPAHGITILRRIGAAQGRTPRRRHLLSLIGLLV